MIVRCLTRRNSFAALALSSAFFATNFAMAEIDYRVAIKPEEKRLEIQISVPVKTGPVSVQMPNWMPGAYVYGNYYENVHDVTAADSHGTALTVTHPDKNTWTSSPTSGGNVVFSYWISTEAQRRFMPSGDAKYVQISGATTYMYVLGRKEESCKVRFDLPPSWQALTGLDADGSVINGYIAPTYDVLADGPVTAGDLIVDHYRLRDRDHYIVLAGAARTQVDQAKLLQDCRFVSAAETDFFGGAPYHKYVWHFIVFPAPDGAGGLEHLSSTQISLASGLGPGAQSVLAHEYFHLWNVKRIRSKPLGPFDYLTLPKTGALWWLEGVTDYYASLLPYRYGEWTKNQFFGSITKNLDTVRSNPARLEVSPNEASLRVADANGGKGNSNGFKISYYNLGWLCGLCLDTEIRARSGNRHSLDDVVRALFEKCKNNQPGFEEDEIRKQCIRFGGPTLGDFYDKVVMQPGELPVEDQLAKMGFSINETDEAYADPGFSAQPTPGSKGLRVGKVNEGNTSGLKVDDVILAVDGTRVDTDDMMSNGRALRASIAKAAVGTPISLEIKRGDQTLSVSVNPSPATRKIHTVVVSPTAVPSASELGLGWLKTKIPSVQ